MQHILKKGVNGALLGAGVGMGVAIAYEFAIRGSALSSSHTLHNDTEEKKIKYEHILKDSELNAIVDDFDPFRIVSPNAYEKLLESLDRLAAISSLIESFSSKVKKDGQEFDAGWTITAHHRAENVREALAALEYSISESMQDDFLAKKKEMLSYLDNTLYNLNMHTQTLLDT